MTKAAGGSPPPIQSLVERLMTSKAHTYASENADYYHGFDAGQRDAGERLSALLQAHRNKWFADDGKQKKWFAEKVLGVPKEET